MIIIIIIISDSLTIYNMQLMLDLHTDLSSVNLH